MRALVSGQHTLWDFFSRLCLPPDTPGLGHSGLLGPVDGSPLARLFDQILVSRPWQTKRYRQAVAPSYRALHGALPTTTRLHHLGMPGIANAMCQLCRTSSDDVPHFLVNCPSRLPVWDAVWGHIYYASPRPTALLRLFLQLDLDFLSRYGPTAATIQLAIWRAYWRLIFDQKPFVHAQVVSTALSMIYKQPKELPS